MKAFLYARVSVEEKGRQKETIPAQIDRLESFCKNNKIEICGIFIDDGISAKDIKKRKDFQRMLDRLDDVDIVLFTRLDRFSRNMHDAAILLELFEKKHCAFRAVDENDVDVSTADGRFLFNLQINLAERERLKVSEREKAVNAYKVKNGFVIAGKMPFGYKIENKRPVIDPEQAEIVREIYDNYLLTQSYTKVIKQLAEKGIIFSQRKISRILKSKFYIGEYRDNQNYFPKIIDTEKFNEVQKILNGKHRERKNVYIFRGLIKCSNCKKIMVGGVKQDGRLYYKCFSKNPLKKSHFLTVSEKKVEKHMLAHICEDLVQIYAEKQEKTEEKRIDTTAIKRKMQKLSDLYLNDLIQREDYEKHYIELRRKLEQKPEKKKEMVNIDDLSQIVNFKYSTYSKEQKRAFWSHLVDYILIEKGGEITPFYKI